jgi:hypothetical protein
VTGSLTDGAENRTLDWLAGHSTTAPTLPLKLALLTVIGSDSAAGTEVLGGSYARQTLTLTTAASGSMSNNADITFAGMPACTVVGFEIYDSAGTPFRWWWGSTSSNVVVSAGASFVVAAGTLPLTGD